MPIGRPYSMLEILVRRDLLDLESDVIQSTCLPIKAETDPP